jgi:hypothetical protein
VRQRSQSYTPGLRDRAAPSIRRLLDGDAAPAHDEHQRGEDHAAGHPHERGDEHGVEAEPRAEQSGRAVAAGAELPFIADTMRTCG